MTMENKINPWKLIILENDPATERIIEFFKKIWSDEIILFNKKDLAAQATKKERVIGDTEPISALEGRILTLYGDGSYHHYTYGLCRATAQRRSNDYLYIHTDNHTDAWKRTNGYLGCGSFVVNITEDAGAKDALLLGSQYGSNELKFTCISQQILASEDAEKTIRDTLKSKAQKDAYLSFDLDVMQRKEIITSYNQGTLELKHLQKIIKVVNEEKNIVSADILGLSCSIISRPKSEVLEPISLLTYATLAAKITGKDTKELEKLHSYFKGKKVNAYDLRDRVLLKHEFKQVTDQLKV